MDLTEIFEMFQILHLYLISKALRKSKRYFYLFIYLFYLNGYGENGKDIRT